ncbi:MAG: sulfatase, partial [Deltaproteobacteria bacterium]|nr:sulfatase [Deltaproteobacteria bacterium]
MCVQKIKYSIGVFVACLVCACAPPRADESNSSDNAVPQPSQASTITLPDSPLPKASAAFRDADAPPLGSNVVIVVVDALRADRLGAYGYSKNTSPMIDELAAQGTLFHRFYAAAPWTAPAFGTIFTGVAPSVHWAGKVVSAEDAPALKTHTKQIHGFSLYPIASQVQTMAEALSCCVDITGAIVSNPFLHPSLGYNRGFTEYDYDMLARDAQTVSDHAITWLNAHAQQQFMLLIHYMDVHQPYAPDLSYQKEFFPMDAGRIQIPMELPLAQLQKMKLTSTELAYIKGLYDAEIRKVDTHLGRVIDTMKTLGLLENTWLVITADHGTEHNDHGSFYHGLQYEDEVTRIPLIVRAPGGIWGAGNQVVYSASQQDLMPTVLDWFGVKAPAYVEGRSLVPLMTGDEKKDRPCYMEMSRMRDDPRSNIEKRFRKRALFDGRYKTIQTEDSAQAWLYDLDRDPEERLSLPPRYPAFVKSVRQLEREVARQLERAESIGASSKIQTLPNDVGESL